MADLGDQGRRAGDDTASGLASGGIVAICGPDGVGKSTLVRELQALVPDQRATVMYGGKKANHHLPTTSLALFILESMRRIPYVRALARSFQALVFQPLEYLENLVRWRAAQRASSRGKLVLFDRFVVDRMWRHHVAPKGRQWVRVNPGDRFFHWLYDRNFPCPDAYLFLAPSPELMFQRAPDEYNSLDHAACVGSAYAALARHLAKSGRVVHQLEFSPGDTPARIAERAWNNLRS